MTKAKRSKMITAIILPLISLFLTLAVLTQAAIKKKYIKYIFFHMSGRVTYMLLKPNYMYNIPRD